MIAPVDKQPLISNTYYEDIEEKERKLILVIYKMSDFNADCKLSHV